ncbi:thioredoxin domain-containing protein [Winogradskyella forsetii]|uniref:thioredoxin domain-containing protein n=1 Tax=Winogradskyella forsetii TaxID=2686077 RepID=UPI0015C0A266|nr:thioredoxin domain-containing protein [Winogradskyella forsetii]
MKFVESKVISLSTLYLTLIIVTLFFSCKEKDANTIGSNEAIISNENTFEFTNELIKETSPYLLEHAHNPVNWKPWGDSAFEQAKTNNKLIVLSIGYSSCHWCHVMEQESFEDKRIAQLMNENFVNIKVDREERPDIDIVYQTALELVSGSGGWPLNVIALPDGKPVYLGTYHDKNSWQSVLKKFSFEYKNNPENLEEYALMLTKGIQNVNENSLGSTIKSVNKRLLDASVIELSEIWDNEWGGNLGNQKFVMPSELNFLIDYMVITNDSRVKKHVKKTLDKIQLGGIHDQIGGGFFRYSTDANWTVPHFEKMLYDNAQILSLYSKAYRVFKNPAYKNVIQKTLNFLSTEMKDDHGGYISAIDADIEGEEGKYYLWKIDELKNLLNDDFELFSKFYTIDNNGRKSEQKYLPTRNRSLKEFAKNNSLSTAKLQMKISNWNHLLSEARKNRMTPKKDDKIITSWNALLVQGFVDAYLALGNKEDLEKAKNTFSFLIKTCYKDHTLAHTFKEKSKLTDVFLEDYAFMIQSALSLYKVTFDTYYLNIAQELSQNVLVNYNLEKSGLFKYSTSNELISKIIRTDDGVMPSANAIMAKNLLELGHINYDTSLLEKSSTMASLVGSKFLQSPQNFGNWGVLYLNDLYPYFEVVVVGDNAKPLVNKLNSYYMPNMMLLGSSEKSDLPLLTNRYVEGETYIYLCQDNTCKMPFQTIDNVLTQFRDLGYFGIE